MQALNHSSAQRLVGRLTIESQLSIDAVACQVGVIPCIPMRAERAYRKLRVTSFIASEPPGSNWPPCKGGDRWARFPVQHTPSGGCGVASDTVAHGDAAVDPNTASPSISYGRCVEAESSATWMTSGIQGTAGTSDACGRRADDGLARVAAK